ncbi:hypothetical protein KSK32_00635 [Micromonospora sp. WMMB482]|nr:hypothetical protein [Micromonospora sp. WMMB482]
MLVGPATFLLLAKGADPFARLDDLVDTYAEILTALAGAGVPWVQLDEPAYVADRSPAEIDGLRRAYRRLGDLADRPRIFVASYFGHLGDALPALLDTPVEAVGVDLVAGRENLDRLAAAGPLGGKTIVAGLVDGRNVWRTDLRAAIAAGATVAALADHVSVSTSCSLLHVPVDLAAETRLDPRLAGRLAFARQKVDEVVLLGRALRDGTTTLPAPLPAAPASCATTTSADASPRYAPTTGNAATTPSAPTASSAASACPTCHHHDRLVPPDRRAARGTRRAPGRHPRRRRLHRSDAHRGRPRHPAAGGPGPGRARARRAGTQRHGPVLRRAARRVRRHGPRLGAVLRHQMRAPARHLR